MKLCNPNAPRSLMARPWMNQGTGASSGSSAPTVPQNFTATAGNSTVELSHDAFAGAIDYKFYRSLSNDFGGAVLVSNPPSADIGFTDTPPEGERYYYWVTADTVSGETGPSASAYARPYVVLTALGSVTLDAPSGSWTFGTILFGSTTPPVGINILYNGTLYSSLGDGTWENTDTFEMATNDPISGSFEVSNSSGSSFTFWNTEP